MCSPAMDKSWAPVDRSAARSVDPWAADRWAGARSVVDRLPGDPSVEAVVCLSAAAPVSGSGRDVAYW